MPTYKIKCTVTVEDAASKEEAIQELQVMLNDYEDNNSDAKEISIHIDNCHEQD